MVRCDRTILRAAQRGFLMLGTLALAACGASMNVTAIEHQIKTDIERQGRRLTLREVRCPDGVAPQAGSYFRCVGELDPDGTFTIHVSQADNQGNVTWEIPNSRTMLNLAQVEAKIQDGLTNAFSQPALVDCGSELYRANQPGDRFECSIIGGLTAGPDVYSSVLVRIEPDGNLNWQEIRQGHQTATAVNQQEASAAPSAPASATPAAVYAEPSAAPDKPTTVTGPGGRKLGPPYGPGNDD